ncbi:MAG: PQQ-binding-like beta-propeller repeat protein [Rickettsiaceae bacterium]|nr:PQQ-binding-like beta-propeller repeat protein [Rickettsiaceae bacterium]
MRIFFIIFILVQLTSCSKSSEDNAYIKLNRLIQTNSIVLNTKKISAEDTIIDVVLPSLSENGPNFEVATKNNFTFTRQSLKEKPTSEAIVINGNLYFLEESGNLVARKLKDLSLIWETNIDHVKNHNCAYGSITYKDEVLYVTYGDSYLVAINARNGYELYRKKFDTMILGNPTIQENKIYIQTISDSLYVINSLDGKVLWSFPRLNDSSFVSTKMAPVVIKNHLVLLSVEGAFYIFNKNTGIYEAIIDPRDMDEVMANKNPTKAVVNEDNNFYVALNNDEIVLFKTPNGSIVWKKHMPNVQQMSLMGNILFVVTNGHQLIALDKSTSNTLWVNDIGINARLNERKATSFIKPIFFNNTIFLAINKYLFQVDAVSGKLLKRANISRLEKPISAHVFDKKLYLVTTRHLYTIK